MSVLPRSSIVPLHSPLEGAHAGDLVTKHTFQGETNSDRFTIRTIMATLANVEPLPADDDEPDVVVATTARALVSEFATQYRGNLLADTEGLLKLRETCTCKYDQPMKLHRPLTSSAEVDTAIDNLLNNDYLTENDQLWQVSTIGIDPLHLLLRGLYIRSGNTDLLVPRSKQVHKPTDPERRVDLVGIAAEKALEIFMIMPLATPVEA